MSLKLRTDYKYSLVVPTSMGVRLTPTDGQPMHSGSTLFMHATSAETNVASVASYLGLPVKVLTTFVKDSPVARFIKDNLASRHMSYEGKEVPQGGRGATDTSSTLQTAVLEPARGVHNDRAGEVGKL